MPVEDLQGRDPKIMARAAIEHLEFGQRRRKGQALVRVFNPTEKDNGYSSIFTFVEMINDDMPFLVDSVAAAIERHNLNVHITVHPIIAVTRNSKGELTGVVDRDDEDAIAESLIRFAIDCEPDAGAIKILRQEIAKVLADVRLAVRDWAKMKRRMLESHDLIENGPKGADPLLRSESRTLLQWLADDHFTFLGYREYELKKKGKRTFLTAKKNTGLGVLSGDDRGTHSVELTEAMQRLARSKDWLILTKANSRSTVHRSAFLDYVGVKIYNQSGIAIGERRFIGLFTSIAYSESPSNIPMIRHKIRQVFRTFRCRCAWSSRQSLVAYHRNLSARRTVSKLGTRPRAHCCWNSQSAGSQTRQVLLAAGYLRDAFFPA